MAGNISAPAGSNLLRFPIAILKFAVAGLILWWMLRQQKAEDLAQLQHIETVCLLVALFLILFQMLASAWRWRCLLSLQGVKLSLWDALNLTWQCFFFSLIIPGGALGGDVVKAVFLSRRLPLGKRFEPISTIFIDRLLGMISLFSMILIFALILTPCLIRLTSPALTIIAILIPGCLLGIIAGVSLFFHHPIQKIHGISQLIPLLERWTRGGLSRMFNSLDLYRSHWRKLIQLIFFTICFIHIPLCLTVATLAHGYQLSPPFLEQSFAVCASNAASTLPLTPGGIGMREFVLQSLMQNLANISSASATIIAFAYGLLTLAVNLLGGLIYLFNPNRIPFHDLEPQKSQDQEPAS